MNYPELIIETAQYNCLIQFRNVILIITNILNHNQYYIVTSQLITIFKYIIITEDMIA